MIAGALVYGCARLTGGASMAASRRLVDRCLAAGITRFDTAPSYGLGTAEQVIGTATAGRADVYLTAKVGSRRPFWPLARTYARAAKAVFRARPCALRTDFVPRLQPGRQAAFDFSTQALARSLDRSLNDLQRDHVDVLLLHEAPAGDLGAEQIAFLRSARAAGTTAQIGWSSGAVVDPAAMSTAPDDFLMQTATPPDLFLAAAAARAPDVMHGVANTLLYAARCDPAFDGWLATAAASIPDRIASPQTARIAAGYALLHVRFPDRRLIFASIDPHRLAAFLAAIHHIDTEIGAAAFVPVATIDPAR